MKVSKKQITIAGACVAFVVATAAVWVIHRKTSPSTASRDEKERMALIQGLIGKVTPVFLSPEYLSVAHGTMQGLPINSQAKKESETALKNPSYFHALNREKHFSAVLLAPTQASSPLCLTLLDSPLWTLTGVVPAGYVFQRAGSGSWIPPGEATILRLHPDPRDRARWLIGTAANLIAIKRTKEAEQLLLWAGKTNCFPSPLLAAEASLAASRGRWNEALSLSRQSLAINSSDTTARVIMIRALIECGRPDEALGEAVTLRSQTSSRNSEALFLLARAANAANDKGEEIRALRDLVSLAREQHHPLGASLTYLGQAYAQNGDRGMALRTFHEALAAPELTGEQREMIRQLISHLKPEDQGHSGR